ncbi:MAG: hypothetical protein ACM3O7_07445 [Acidobacteriota bacterium]
MGQDRSTREAQRRYRQDGRGPASGRRRARRQVLLAAGWLVVVAAVATWIPAVCHAITDAFLYVPAQIIPGEVRRSVLALDGLLAPSDRVAYLGGGPQLGWTCGLWERAAYPRTVFCLDTSQPAWQAELDILTRQYGLRYVITEGALPPSIPLASRRELLGQIDLIEITR